MQTLCLQKSSHHLPQWNWLWVYYCIFSEHLKQTLGHSQGPDPADPVGLFGQRYPWSEHNHSLNPLPKTTKILPLILKNQFKQAMSPLVLVHNLAGAGGPCVTWGLLPTCHWRGDTYLPTISVSAAVCSPSLSDTSLVPSQDPSLHQSKPTPDILADPSSPCPLELPRCRKQRRKSRQRGEQLLLPSHLPVGSRACCVLEWPFQLSQVPRNSQGSFPPFSPPLPLPAPCAALRSAAAPARAPNALTTAVGLIIKITF